MKRSYIKRHPRRKHRANEVADEATLDLYRGAGVCDYCKRRVSRREPHHLVRRGCGGGSRYDVPVNLMSLGSAYECGCHQAVHDGGILRCDLIAVQAAKLGLLQADVEDQLNALKWGKIP